tara:strand:+ start:723 stop:911 length:189 start_codon:yes stop_codon:yes gene_type:complete
MKIIHITFKSVPDHRRYTILSDGEKSAIYKRFLSIFYVRVSKVYEGYDVWTEVIKEYDKLTK